MEDSNANLPEINHANTHDLFAVRKAKLDALRAAGSLSARIGSPTARAKPQKSFLKPKARAKR